MADISMTAEQVEQMRALLAQHDAKPLNQSFDLNNPPKKPYVHQEYPRVMYHHGKRQIRSAANEAEMHEAMECGWVKEPFLTNVEAPEPEPGPAPVPKKGKKAE